MARPREFDINQALDAALDTFWANGYEGTSMAELMDAMGLSKSSIYDTFGCKHELFLSAIDRYAGARTESAEKAFLSAPSGRRAIEQSFRRIVDEAMKGGPLQGCFAMNCAIEGADSDPRAAEKLRVYFARYPRNYEIMVRRAQAAGEIPETKDASVLGQFLTSSAYGLLVMAKANPNRDVLEDIVSTVLATLD